MKKKVTVLLPKFSVCPTWWVNFVCDPKAPCATVSDAQKKLKPYAVEYERTEGGDVLVFDTDADYTIFALKWA